jgi:acetyl-CoA acetyltransferase
MDDIAVVGIGRTAYSRDSGRSTKAMAVEACRNAIVDAGLSARDVDGVANFSAGDSTMSLAVAHGLGIDELVWCVDLFGGGNACVSAVAAAAAAVSAGQCHVAVVYRSLNGRSGHRFGTASGQLTLSGDMQFTGPHGYLVPPQWMAMWARRHQAVYGSTCEDLGRIAITQRDHATANPHAIKRERITMDDYLASRWINEPLRLLDCTMEVDGAAAVVLTSLERAHDLAKPPVRLAAVAEAHGYGGSWEEWPDMTTMFSSHVAPRLWDATGLGPTDIDVACIYDCFTYTVMCVMEDLGFCAKGEVGAFFGDGRATYGGDVVVNPHGGLLSEGYIHGMNHHFEAVLQLRGEASERQVQGAETALVTSGGGPYGGAVVYTIDA